MARRPAETSSYEQKLLRQSQKTSSAAGKSELKIVSARVCCDGFPEDVAIRVALRHRTFLAITRPQLARRRRCSTQGAEDNDLYLVLSGSFWVYVCELRERKEAVSH